MMPSPLPVTVVAPSKSWAEFAGGVAGKVLGLFMVAGLIWWITPMVLDVELTYWQAVGARVLAGLFFPLSLGGNPDWVGSSSIRRGR